MSWLPWNRQPTPLPTKLERLRRDVERADAGVARAAARESVAWVTLRGAMRDAATAAELRLKARRALETAEAEAAAELAAAEGVVVR